MFTFVGEKKSATALSRGWSWADGRLAAKQLFDALRSCRIDPDEQRYFNLFEDGGWNRAMDALMRRDKLVAMGQRVHQALTLYDIPHVTIVHPAARGAIRGKHAYMSHVRSVLYLAR